MASSATPTNRLIAVLATVAVGIALLPMPYGYFTLLRLLLCAASVFYFVQLGRELSDFQKLALGALAVLYNPILPIHLGSKPLWSIVNIATVVLFWSLPESHRRKT